MTLLISILLLLAYLKILFASSATYISSSHHYVEKVSYSKDYLYIVQAADSIDSSIVVCLTLDNSLSWSLSLNFTVISIYVDSDQVMVYFGGSVGTSGFIYVYNQQLHTMVASKTFSSRKSDCIYNFASNGSVVYFTGTLNSELLVGYYHDSEFHIIDIGFNLPLSSGNDINFFSDYIVIGGTASSPLPNASIRGGSDLFILLLDSELNYIRSTMFGTSDNDILGRLIVDDQICILVGSTSGSFLSESESETTISGFILQVNCLNGTILEVYQNVSDGNDIEVFKDSIAINDKIYVVGYVSSSGRTYSFLKQLTLLNLIFSSDLLLVEDNYSLKAVTISNNSTNILVSGTAYYKANFDIGYGQEGISRAVGSFFEMLLVEPFIQVTFIPKILSKKTVNEIVPSFDQDTKSDSILVPILSTVLVVSVLLIIAVLIFLWILKQKKRTYFTRNEGVVDSIAFSITRHSLSLVKNNDITQFSTFTVYDDIQSKGIRKGYKKTAFEIKSTDNIQNAESGITIGSEKEKQKPEAETEKKSSAIVVSESSEENEQEDDYKSTFNSIQGATKIIRAKTEDQNQTAARDMKSIRNKKIQDAQMTLKTITQSVETLPVESTKTPRRNPTSIKSIEPISANHLNFPTELEYKQKDFVVVKMLFEKQGSVFYVGEAQNENLKKEGRLIVLKVYKDSKAKLTKEEWAKFEKEVAIMNHLHGHPHFAKILGFCSNPVALILKCYSKGSLDHWIFYPKYVKTKTSIMNFAIDIASGLNQMHEAGFVHFDLKTSSVLLEINADGSLIACLGDFSTTRLADEKSQVIISSSIWETKDISIPFFAPEQILRLKRKADNYISLVPAKKK